MMREMTVQEFAQEVKNMAMEIMPITHMMNTAT